MEITRQRSKQLMRLFECKALLVRGTHLEQVDAQKVDFFTSVVATRYLKQQAGALALLYAHLDDPLCSQPAPRRDRAAAPPGEWRERTDRDT